MQIHEVMTERPACCTPDTSLRKMAQAMAENDCGALPVIEKTDGRQIIGVVTDRDIVVRAVAQETALNHICARDIMTRTPVTVVASGDVEDAREAMGTHQLRRVLVTEDGDKACAGIVTQADLARYLDVAHSGETLQLVSQPAGASTLPPDPTEQQQDGAPEQADRPAPQQPRRQ
jgi:CBS domain-containing protein